jgi:hypothetical protein
MAMAMWDVWLHDYVSVSLYVLNVNHHLFGFFIDDWVEPPQLFAPDSWDISAESGCLQLG